MYNILIISVTLWIFVVESNKMNELHIITNNIITNQLAMATIPTNFKIVCVCVCVWCMVRILR